MRSAEPLDDVREEGVGTESVVNPNDDRLFSRTESLQNQGPVKADIGHSSPATLCSLTTNRRALPIVPHLSAAHSSVTTAHRPLRTHPITHHSSLITHHLKPLSTDHRPLSTPHWRSLEELADTEEFHRWLHREFPEQASEWHDPVGRRRFLKLMGASLALAGLTACTRQPPEKIVPYVRQPEELVPGKPLFFATAATLGGFAIGVLVESHEGRPTKIEGNPDHPASLGATDVFAQASILGLYDPDRPQTVTNLGEISTWSAFVAAITVALNGQRSRRGAGLRLLTETVTSPTLTKQVRDLLTQFPQAKWHQYEPISRDNVRAGSQLAFGQYVNTVYRLDAADVILALDSDFLSTGPGCLRYTRDFSKKRRIAEGVSEMNRLYAVESTPSITGAKADHRLRVRAVEVEAVTRVIAAGLGIEAGPVESAPNARWIDAVVKDLKNRAGASVVIAGDEQPPVVHGLAHAMNHALGNVGKTVLYTDPVEANVGDQTESLRRLAQEMEEGQVDALVILGGNPVYSAPVDLNFGERLAKVPLRAHLGAYYDETSELCHWHVPEAHYLESWSDVRAYDGAVSIVQPLIAPLYNGKSAHELLAALLGQPERSGYDVVREYWKGVSSTEGEAFEQRWRRWLHDGIVSETALQPRAVTMKSGWNQQIGNTPASDGNLEIIFRADPGVFDGRFANNGWLQEVPKPLTKLTWDNAALISPATASRLGLSNEEVVELSYGGRTIEAPVFVLPGQPDDSVTVHLGYGRTRSGRVGTGAGFNAYALRSSDAPWFGSGLEVRGTGRRWPLATTQLHHNVEGRDILRSGTLEEYGSHPSLAPEGSHASPEGLSMYPSYEYDGYAWGMAIDLNSCIGCNACVVACQAENNIPVVGKEQVARGREMHWIRVDRYYKGDQDDPETHFQPLPCMHCENAPCEVVCPVVATVHSAEGLNDMVYNRCVGTRYCANNCPYKVRRFNFLLYQDWETPSLKLMRNPDVSVRSRGVMEKCTYCVQRINRARIEAKKEDRGVRDGEIVTACQAVCPAEAIVFGNINDPNSRVAKLKAEPRNYSLLGELNTRPRTTYLGALRNVNPELED